MRCWRICRVKHVAVAFDGNGAKERPGRWNSVGTRAAYCSSMPSLAYLEYLTAVDSEDAPDDLRLIEIEVPDGAILHVAVARLSADWRDVPAPESTRAFGDEWLRSGRSLTLAVPSVNLPVETATVEWNLVINPLHPDFAGIKASPPIKADLGRFFVT